MTKLLTYKHRKTFCFSDQQIKAFAELERCDVNVSQFVRLAIKEKIQRDYKKIKEEKVNFKTPF